MHTSCDNLGGHASRTCYCEFHAGKVKLPVMCTVHFVHMLLYTLLEGESPVFCLIVHTDINVLALYVFTN